MTYEDITVAVEDGVAVITINRPDRANKLRFQTARELLDAFRDVRADPQVDVAVLTGAGEKFFCIGGEHEELTSLDYSQVMPVIDLYEFIDTMPKVVIAAVNGFAVGGGNVLQVVCDLTVAAEHAVFRQVGPLVGSFDAGYGTWYLEETIGRRRAKEMWYLNKKYTAEEALGMGLVNEVVTGRPVLERAVELGPGPARAGAVRPGRAEDRVLGQAHRRRGAGADGPRPAADRLPADRGVRGDGAVLRASAAPRSARSSTGERAGRRSRAVPRGAHHAAEQARGARGALGRCRSGWSALEQALDEADVLGLAVETVDMDGRARWLADVVRTIAHSSPSLALVLAARYTAHRVIGAGARGVRRKGEGNHRRARLPRRPRHRLGRRCPRDDPRVVRPRGHRPSRRRRRGWADRRGGGCRGRAGPGADRARRRAVVARSAIVGDPTRTLDPVAASAAVDDLTLLTAAAALGVAEAALAASAAYAAERRQFGSALLSFAGMRAMLAEMQLRVSTRRRAPRSGARHRHDRGLSGSWRRPRVARRSTSRSTPSRCTAGTATSTSTPSPTCCATLSASARAHPADRACRASPRSDSGRSDEEAHTRPARSS